MSYPKACCSTPTIVSYYKPTGSTLNISSIPVYSVVPDVESVEKQLRAKGVIAATCAGFFWGAKVAVQLISTMPLFVGACMIHPSAIDPKYAEAAGAPIYYISSKDEPKMRESMNILQKKSMGDCCHLIAFGDMDHGFSAARGDFNDEQSTKRANKAIQITIDIL
ncbi:unnamed protein product [Mucor circinelloides]